MIDPFIIISGGLILAIILENIIPRDKLPYKKGWIKRAIIFNSIQLLIVIVAGYTWETWLEGPSLFKLPWSPFWNGIFAYIITSWVFYWWHWLRHENTFLWLFVHQFHHSPVRIEAITSFYKHPIEIIINSWIITILTCPILGLDTQTNAWLTIFTALAEFFYHINISTPHWIGYFIQRPEMHLAHHREDKQFTCNHGDLAIWDLLGGTWFNPTKQQSPHIKTGFSHDRERLLLPMLLGKNILPERPKKLPKKLFQCILITLLFILGSMQIIGLIFDSPTIKALSIVSCSSPLPFVFTSYNGIETFSTTFELNITTHNHTNIIIHMDHKLYSQLQGPYNRKNVIGVIFSHGPFFKDPNMIAIRNQILHWSFCKGNLSDEFNIHYPIKESTINIRSKTNGNENKVWSMHVRC